MNWNCVRVEADDVHLLVPSRFPGESSFGQLLRFAFLNDLSVNAAVTRANRSRAVADALQIPHGCSMYMWVRTSQAFDVHVGDGIRYCPICADHGLLPEIFAFGQVSRCPLHDVFITNKCAHCDIFLRKSWLPPGEFMTCHQCKRRLTGTPVDRHLLAQAEAVAQALERRAAPIARVVRQALDSAGQYESLNRAVRLILDQTAPELKDLTYFRAPGPAVRAIAFAEVACSPSGGRNRYHGLRLQIARAAFADDPERWARCSLNELHRRAQSTRLEQRQVALAFLIWRTVLDDNVDAVAWLTSRELNVLRSERYRLEKEGFPTPMMLALFFRMAELEIQGLTRQVLDHRPVQLGGGSLIHRLLDAARRSIDLPMATWCDSRCLLVQCTGDRSIDALLNAGGLVARRRRSSVDCGGERVPLSWCPDRGH